MSLFAFYSNWVCWAFFYWIVFFSFIRFVYRGTKGTFDLLQVWVWLGLSPLERGGEREKLRFTVLELEGVCIGCGLYPVAFKFQGCS